MQQQVPGALLGEPRLTRSPDQIGEIGVVGAPGGSRGRRDQQEGQQPCDLSVRERRV